MNLGDMSKWLALDFFFRKALFKSITFGDRNQGHKAS